MTDPATLKNDTQRKEWLANYQDWDVWYVDEHIGATYYKYDFQNGARIIAEEYIIPTTRYLTAYRQPYLHLVGGPNVDGRIYHEVYTHEADSRTYLTDYLKATKGGTQ